MYVYFEDTPHLACSHSPTLLPPEERRGGSWHRRPTARQQGPKGDELVRVAKAKPLGQSTPASESSFRVPGRIINPKESARFGPKRPVDAHFRSAPSGAPTPNRSKPPRQTRIEAAQGPSPHPLQSSTRLAQPSTRYAPSNFASRRLLLKSATDRRQQPPASRKFGSYLRNTRSKQQKSPELPAVAQSPTAQHHTPAEGNRLHDQLRGEFNPPDRHRHHQNCTPD